jgi:acetyl esterase/lipase
MRKISLLILLVAIVVPAVIYKETTLKLVAGGVFKLFTWKETYFPAKGLEDWSPEARAFTLATSLGDNGEKPDYKQVRTMMQTFAYLQPPPSDVIVTPFQIARVPAAWFTPADAHPTRTVLYFHSGGIVIGSINVEAHPAAYLAKKLSARVLSVDYSLMPENSIQDAVNDAIAVYRYLIKLERVNPDQLVVYGCSAGGVMTILTTVAAKHKGFDLPAAIAPWAVSLGFEYLSTYKPEDQWESRQYSDKRIYSWLPPSMADWFAEFAHATKANNDTIKKYFTDLKDLPPINIQVGEYDPLRDGNLQFIEELKKHGNEVEHTIFPRMFHCPSVLSGILPEGRQSLNGLAEWMLSRFKLERVKR